MISPTPEWDDGTTPQDWLEGSSITASAGSFSSGDKSIGCFLTLMVISLMMDMLTKYGPLVHIVATLRMMLFWMPQRWNT